MYHFKYVSKKDAMPYKKELIEIINKVQDEVRDRFTFQFTFIGSSKRNMITYDPTTNKGFDFDVNLEVNDDDELYSAQEIRNILRKAFNHIVPNYGYSYCENSTRVLTIKHINYWQSRIEYSCDFAIVYNSQNGQQYIRYNKSARTYTWEFQKQPYEELEKRADALKYKGCWNEVLDVYLYKKNTNDNPYKHSRSFYVETINECYSRHFSKTQKKQNG